MISVIVLGTGNVGMHLINAFLGNSAVELVQVYSRRKSSLKFIEKKVDTTTSVSSLKSADIYIIAISDDAIPEFSSQLNLKNKLVVHTSGGSSINVLKTNGNKGVFYPLQTFSKEQSIDFKSIPICVESENNEDLILLKKLANTISNNVFMIDSEQRKHLHIAAVFTNNFVNHLYKIGFDICKENNIPYESLYPLIQETAQKIMYAKPDNVQTGPAMRNDTIIIEKHLNLLSGEKYKIYQLLTDSIQATYGKKL
ncbi:MAG: DUF2520 domain-containing protein [Aureibaculum sp.]|nr:DUF2520 domain-containing protein [Aureibaculum sp.]